MTADPTAIIHNPGARRFETSLPDGLGVCEYRHDGDGVLALTHTEVPPSATGRGVAGALVQAALDWARAEGLKVRTPCSYAAAYIERHPDTHDLRA